MANQNDGKRGGAGRGGSKAKGGEPGRSRARPDPEEAVVNAALTLAAERSWRDIGLAEIAAAAGLSMAELYPRLGSKQAVLAAFSRRIDGLVLDEPAPGPGEPARDRLFDVLMRRFDALQPHRLALGNILRDQMRAPGEALGGLNQLCRSMAWMLTAAGIPAEGLAGRLKIQALVGIYLAAMRVFLRDESADLARTMAALDGHLRRAEWVAGRLWRRSRFGSGPHPETREGVS